MADVEGGGSYVIDIEYTDAGFQMVFDMDEWREKIEEDFTTFDSIKKFYRKDPREFEAELSEAAQEVQPDETLDEPGIIVKNAPKEWKEDSAVAAPYIAHSYHILVELGLQVLISDELADEDALLEQEQYKPLVVRQSAFFEEYTTLQTLLELQSFKGETLSSRELDIIDRMGHQDRLRFAHLLGIFDEDDHGLLQTMANWRNDIAHTAWPEFVPQDEAQIESVAKQVTTLLRDELYSSQAETAELESTSVVDDTFIGFPALDVELQNLQLGILAILRREGGRAQLSKVKNILPDDDGLIAQRCLRMDDIGYLEMSDGNLTIKDRGEDLLHEYWDQY